MDNIRFGYGCDVHRLVEGRELVLCGVKVPFEKGLLGHSDADVATHALIDALLGAAALGDIGKHFPDTSAEFAGISSITLLERTRELLRQAGFAIGNADVTILAEKPKLAPYITEMREVLAVALGLELGRVSVKATTTEGLGFVGAGAGLEARAVCGVEARA